MGQLATPLLLTKDARRQGTTLQHGLSTARRSADGHLNYHPDINVSRRTSNREAFPRWCEKRKSQQLGPWGNLQMARRSPPEGYLGRDPRSLPQATAGGLSPDRR
ncbi:unnamed protein product [Cuscuta epithymum]|uniref:Uncharacterized protein n=1 Tax=Cuscuta epithymum TaxID=186058 RepID=A0AAV0EDN4_9ASTE|nr:unnamed protein product [Cuscuta epithymum]